jgi:hypothetical protein
MYLLEANGFEYIEMRPVPIIMKIVMLLNMEIAL